MLHKHVKPPNDPKSFRPITLLPVSGKCFKTTIKTRLEKYALKTKWIPNIQAGYWKPFYNWPHHKTHQWSYNGLYHKLLTDGVPAQLRKLIMNILYDRPSRDHVNNKPSMIFYTEAGEPQCAILSPLLYTLCTADIPEMWRWTERLTLYANNTAHCCHAPTVKNINTQMQEYLDK